MADIELYNHPIFQESALIAYYRMADANDSKGTNHGTATAMSYAAGRFGNGGVFNGSSSHIQVPNSAAMAALGNTTASYSVGAWFKSSIKVDQSITEKWTTNYPFVIRGPQPTTGYVSGHVYDGTTGSGVVATQDYSDGLWHQVVFVRDRAITKLRLFMDGVQFGVDANDIATANISNTGVMEIGCRNGPVLYFNGMIDDFFILGRVLTPEEAYSIYDFSSPKFLESPRRNRITGPINRTTMEASGGTISFFNKRKIHKFTGDGTFSVTKGGYARILMVGGGGAGGGGIGGGGGGGGVLKIPNTYLAPGDYSIVIGQGGTGVVYPTRSNNGGDTTAFGATAKGGGGSGCHDAGIGYAGGSGGGAASNNSQINQGGASSGNDLGQHVGTIYGNRGGHMTVARTGTPTRGAGGGGAGGPGVDTNTNTTGDLGHYGGGAGGPGIEDNILGISYYWGAGGGGGSYQTNGGRGGIGGGGGAGGDTAAGPAGPNGLNAGGSSNNPGGAGGTNTGAGGGAAIWQTTTGGAGGSGIVVVSYSVKNTDEKKQMKRTRIANTGVSAPSTFLPTSISSCRLWIDISRLTLNEGDDVSSVADLSGYNNNLAQRTASQNPHFIKDGINGLPVMRGTAAASTTWDIPWAYAAPNTLFFVAKKTGISNGRGISGKTNNWLMGFWNMYESQLYCEGWVGANSDIYVTVQPIVWSAVVTSTSYLWRNGILVKSSTGGVTAPAGLTLGYLGTNEFTDMDIGEIIGYNAVLSTADRQSVESYLMQKWGLIM